MNDLYTQTTRAMPLRQIGGILIAPGSGDDLHPQGGIFPELNVHRWAISPFSGARDPRRSTCTGASSRGLRPASCACGRRCKRDGLIFVPVRAVQVHRLDRRLARRGPQHVLDLRGDRRAWRSTRGWRASGFSCCSGRSRVIISWSAFWDKILSDGIGAHFGIYRGPGWESWPSCLLAGALWVWRTKPGRGRDRVERDQTGR